MRNLMTIPLGLAALFLGLNSHVGAQTGELGIRVERLLSEPIIAPGIHPSIGENIQGPSLIRVPDWIEDPLGAYYLYFADHKGLYIRMAYADDLKGPWRIYAPGSLPVSYTHLTLPTILLV